PAIGGKPYLALHPPQTLRRPVPACLGGTNRRRPATPESRLVPSRSQGSGPTLALHSACRNTQCTSRIFSLARTCRRSTRRPPPQFAPVPVGSPARARY